MVKLRCHANGSFMVFDRLYKIHDTPSRLFGVLVECLWYFHGADSVKNSYQPCSAAEWATLALAVVLVVLGLPLLVMGVQLALLGGSVYYCLFGAALILAGVLMGLRSLVGPYLYLAACACTWGWAFWEVGLDAWGLLPRLLVPTVLAVAVVLTLPVLYRCKATAQLSKKV